MSYRLIDSNELVDKVNFETQDIVNNMNCVHVDGIELSNQHFNLKEHDARVRADVLEELIEEFKQIAYDTEGEGYISFGHVMLSVKQIIEKLKEKKNNERMD